MGSAIGERVIRMSVLEACTRAAVPHDSSPRRQLESEAGSLPDGSRAAYVRTSSGVSLDERIGELKTVTKFAADLPTAKPTVQSTDTEAISQNFSDIAAGKVTVVK